MQNKKTPKRIKDKSDFSTVDKVLDHTSIGILEKQTRNKKLFDISGALFSGKEANVYSAKCSTTMISKLIQPEEEEEKIIPVLIKIYKTSTMMFKDRSKYIVDEERFKNFCTSNSRKLIKLWGEKEVRNLKRLRKHGILCPRPLYLKKSILIMSLIGDNEPAPRLRDIDLDDWDKIYCECLQLLQDMYKKAGLIHCDFSEYNLLYWNERVHVIDVGQSIEKNHENSNTFLLMDIKNCNEFFKRKGVHILNEVKIFEETTGLKIPEYLKTDGFLNKDVFIPSRISEVVNAEDFKLFLVENNKNEKENEKENENENENEIENENEKEIENEIESSKNNSLENNSLNDDKLDYLKNINILVRRLTLKNSLVTKDEEKNYNKVRKQLVKDNNKERRISRSIKNDRIKTQKIKKKTKNNKKTQIKI